ncbi:MAG: TonB-dependent receptor [Gemmatimonadetes bacterium]|nr:TonB-dependent receptor [Gemmatimonadota bacterium]
MIQTITRGALAAALTLFLVEPMSAQERPGRFIGRVVDHDNGKPLQGARITLRDTDRSAMTDQQGYFEITDIRPGLHAFDAELLGFESRSSPVRVLSGQTIEAEVRMSAKPIELPPIEVSVRSPRLEASGFYDRRLEFGSQGRFITRDLIERRNPQIVTDLLYNQPGLRVEYDGVGRRRVTVNRNAGCTPMLYLDGVSGDNTNFDVVRPETIEGIEIYIGAMMPIQYQSRTDCGVILIWTRRGSRG